MQCPLCHQGLPSSFSLPHHFQHDHPEIVYRMRTTAAEGAGVRQRYQGRSLQCLYDGSEFHEYAQLVEHYRRQHPEKLQRDQQHPTPEPEPPAEAPEPPEEIDLAGYVNWLTARYRVLEARCRELEARRLGVTRDKLGEEFWQVYEDYRRAHGKAPG